MPVPRTASCSRPTEMQKSDRRVHQRYPISLEVEYKLLDRRGSQRKGLGRTINISSRGVLLHLNETPPSLGTIEFSVKWPFLLDGSIPLRWIVHGSVIRVAGSNVAVQVTDQVFHTAGRDHPKNRRQQ